MSRGFTLIEVMGALVIFSAGVLMTLSMTDTLAEQLNRAAVRSELVARARTAMDSLEAEGYASLAPASRVGSVTVRGREFRESLEVQPYGPLLLEISVSLEPSSGRGPRHALTSYLSGPW